MTRLEEMSETVAKCEKCRLCEGRTNVVFGTGNPNADILFVGEGPGHDEDLQGEPFVGAAGKLLDRMLAAIKLDRKAVYIANVVKCRPPKNRVPEDDEAQACLPYLRLQYALIRPKIVVCLGSTAGRYLYDPEVRIGRDHGVWKQKNGVWFMATYHPAALLRDESKKRDAWADMQAIAGKYSELKGA